MPFTLRSTLSMLVSDWRSICARVTVLTDCGVSRGVSCRRVDALSRAPDTVTLSSALGSTTWSVRVASAGEVSVVSAGDPAVVWALAVLIMLAARKAATARGWRAQTRCLRGACMRGLLGKTRWQAGWQRSSDGMHGWLGFIKF